MPPRSMPSPSGSGHGSGEVTQGPYDTDYGSHDVAVRDPEGNHWQFGTYHGAPRSLSIAEDRIRGRRLIGRRVWVVVRGRSRVAG